MGRKVVSVLAFAVAGLMLGSLALAQPGDRAFRRGRGDDEQVIGQARRVRQWIIRHPELAARILADIHKRMPAPAWQGKARERGGVSRGRAWQRPMMRPRGRMQIRRFMAGRQKRMRRAPSQAGRWRQVRRRWMRQRFAGPSVSQGRGIIERISRLNARVNAIERRLARLEGKLVKRHREGRPAIKAKHKVRRGARSVLRLGKARAMRPRKARAVRPGKARAVRPRKTRAVRPRKTRAVRPGKARRAKAQRAPAERLRMIAERLKQREAELDRREARLKQLAKRLKELQRRLEGRRKHRREADED